VYPSLVSGTALKRAEGAWQRIVALNLAFDRLLQWNAVQQHAFAHAVAHAVAHAIALLVVHASMP